MLLKKQFVQLNFKITFTLIDATKRTFGISFVNKEI